MKIYIYIVERTDAGVEWLIPVLAVPGSILSWGTFSCGLEQVTFSTAPKVMHQSFVNTAPPPRTHTPRERVGEINRAEVRGNYFSSVPAVHAK